MIDDTLRPLIVAKKTDEAHNMVSFELVDPNGAELPAFSAGSHIDVTIPGGLVRQYSLCNSTSDATVMLLVYGTMAIAGWVQGVAWTGACGRHLQVGLPRNRFRVPAVRNGPFCWQGASGVTRFWSIADYLKSQNIPFELIMFSP